MADGPGPTITFRQAYWQRIDPPRELTSWERQIIGRILSGPEGRETDLPDSEAVRLQLPSVRVNEACLCCLSIGLTADSESVEQIPGAPSGMIGDLYGEDTDGMVIWALLFVQTGYLVELEVQRADGSPFTYLPDPQLFRGSPSKGEV